MFYFWEGALRPPNFEILLMFSSYLRSSVLDGGGVVEHKVYYTRYRVPLYLW